MNPCYEFFDSRNSVEKGAPTTVDEMGIDFRNTFGMQTGWTPIALEPERNQQHIQMIRDEFEKELIPALESGDLTEIYDAGIDVIVYIQNLLGESGMPLLPGLREVFNSNMTKLDPVTKTPIRATKDDPSGEPEGKVLKGKNYIKPQFEKLISILSYEKPLFTVTPFEANVNDGDLIVYFTCALCGRDNFRSTDLRRHAALAHDLLSGVISLNAGNEESVDLGTYDLNFNKVAMKNA